MNKKTDILFENNSKTPIMSNYFVIFGNGYTKIYDGGVENRYFNDFQLFAHGILQFFW